MKTRGDEFDDLMQLASSDERRVGPEEAAKILGLHRRTLEEQRRRSRLEDGTNKPDFRRGPRFIKLGRRILYEVHELKRWQSLRPASSDCLTPKEAAEFLGKHLRTTENWRRTWDRARADGNPDLRRGPPFHRSGNRVWYERHDLIAYRDSCATTNKGKDESDSGASD